MYRRCPNPTILDLEMAQLDLNNKLYNIFISLSNYLYIFKLFESNKNLSFDL